MATSEVAMVPVTPKVGIASGWFRYWFSDFDPDGAADPRKRHVTKAGARVEYTAIDGSRRTGRLAAAPPPAIPPYTFFDSIVRDSDNTVEMVPASRIYPEGQMPSCSRCSDQPPAGFVCGLCGNG